MYGDTNKPTISIIVPVYNVEKYLKRCIDSILNQTFKDFELILVNDGSTDGCKEICNEYKNLDNRIKVIHKVNGGLSSARNAGLDIAQGRYIGFVDSDDYIAPRMYEVLKNNLEKNNSSISICGYVHGEQKDYKFIDLLNNTYINYNAEQALSQLYKKDHINFVVAWNKLYKNNIFRGIRYPNGKIHEDEFIAHKLIFKAEKITCCSEKLYYYYNRENSIMNKKFSFKNLDKLYYLNDRMRFLEKNDFDDLSKQAKSDFVFEFFKLYFKAKSELNLPKGKLKKVKNIYNKNIIKLITEKSYSFKEKVLFVLFFLNDKFYEIYCNNNEFKLINK